MNQPTPTIDRSITTDRSIQGVHGRDVTNAFVPQPAAAAALGDDEDNNGDEQQQLNGVCVCVKQARVDAARAVPLNERALAMNESRAREREREYKDAWDGGGVPSLLGRNHGTGCC
jgi:hypothetical protein